MLPFCLITAGGHHFHTLPLPCSEAPVSQGGELLHKSGALIFAATTQGMPLDFLVLEAKRNCIPGYHGTVSIKETVLGSLPPPRHCTDSRLKHTLIFI